MHRSTIALLAMSACLLAAAAPPRAEAPPPWPADAAALESFFNPIFEQEMARRNIPGAVCILVGDGRVLFQKGYGVVDSETKRPVDIERTVFRLASVSKVFTAVAVMQLVEQGRLDLHRDVNAYLKKLQLPATYPEPVTLDHLLTHTAGFDDRYLGMGARNDAELPALGDYLARNMPPRVMPPGRYFSYSNHGFALAGHIVEEISGMPFPEYARRFIFEPLGMTRSTFVLTPGWLPTLVTGYMDFRGTRSPVVVDAPQTVPASSLASTAPDMARFMIALLQLGRFGDRRILGETAASDMMATHFTQRHGLPGRAYALEERFENGFRVLEHGGHIWGCISEMILIPDKNVGLFMSYNTQEVGMDNVVCNAFYERFFPAAPEPAAWTLAPGWEARRDGIGGYFRINRYTRTTFLKFGTIATEVAQEIRLRPGQTRGTLQLDYLDTLGRTHSAGYLVEVEPDFYRRVDRRRGADPRDWQFTIKGRVALERDDAGQVSHVFIDGRAFERMRWFEERPVFLAGVVLSLLLPLSWLLAAPIRRLIRSAAGSASQTALAHRTARLLTLTAAVQFVFIAGFAAFLWFITPNEVGYGPPPVLIPLLSLTFLIFGGTCLMAAGIIVSWVRGWWGLAQRIHATLATMGLALFTALLHYWNLLGFQFH